MCDKQRLCLNYQRTNIFTLQSKFFQSFFFSNLFSIKNTLFAKTFNRKTDLFKRNSINSHRYNKLWGTTYSSLDFDIYFSFHIDERITSTESTHNLFIIVQADIKSLWKTDNIVMKYKLNFGLKIKTIEGILKTCANIRDGE